MKCSRCRHENRPGAKFCEECAAPLELACDNCGALLTSTAKFCPECAHPTGKTAAAPEPVNAPARYTPKHLAEKILLSKSALEGERKQVTVLFADFKGSMELLADRDPEEADRAVALARARQNRSFEARALKVLADVYTHAASEIDQSGAEQAAGLYRQALALATELGVRPLVAHCHLALGKLYARTNSRDQAREHLYTATTMYREMDMRFWLAQAEAVLEPSPGNHS